MKASKYIAQECCGVGLLTIEKADLVGRVEALESENNLLKCKYKFTENQLENAIAVIDRLNKLIKHERL